MAQIKLGFRPLKTNHYNDTLHYTQPFIKKLMKTVFCLIFSRQRQTFDASLFHRSARLYIRRWHQFHWNNLMTNMEA
jgi:hypothetical protein